MKPTQMYFLRHGESELNHKRIFAGPSVDPALTPSGVQEAALQAAAWRDIPFSAIYSSPAKRALQTALTMNTGRQLEVLISDRLKEVDIGELDGQSIDIPENLAVYRSVISKWEQDVRTTRFPGGESLADVESRAYRFFEGLTGSDLHQPILVVAHGILFMSVLWLFGRDRSDRIQDYYMGRCHLTIVSWDGSQLHLEKVNMPPVPGAKSESALS
jgi:broad specificity phosphatase PhoE